MNTAGAEITWRLLDIILHFVWEVCENKIKKGWERDKKVEEMQSTIWEGAT